MKAYDISRYFENPNDWRSKELARFYSDNAPGTSPISDEGANLTVGKNRLHCRGLLTSLHLKLIIGAFAFLLLALIAYIVTLSAIVPGILIDAVAAYDTGGNWPPMDFQKFTQNAFYFNMSRQLPMSNYFDTKLEFDDYMVFSVKGRPIANMSIPPMTFGPKKRYFLEHTFKVNIIDVPEWERLWKQWTIAATTTSAVPDEWKQPTIWNITVPATLSMLGMRWTNIPLKSYMEWTGGLSSGSAPVDLKLREWEPLSSFTSPGISLTFAYNNSKSFGVNLGDFQFALYSVYRTNNTFSEPVRLLDIRFPEFFYRPGHHNLTVANRFLRTQPKAIRSSLQLATNFIANKTSLLIMKDFRSSYDGIEPTWLTNIFKQLSFLVQLNRQKSLRKLLAKKVKEKTVQTTVNHVNDLEPTADGKSINSTEIEKGISPADIDAINKLDDDKDKSIPESMRSIFSRL